MLNCMETLSSNIVDYPARGASKRHTRAHDAWHGMDSSCTSATFHISSIYRRVVNHRNIEAGKFKYGANILRICQPLGLADPQP